MAGLSPAAMIFIWHKTQTQQWSGSRGTQWPWKRGQRRKQLQRGLVCVNDLSIRVSVHLPSCLLIAQYSLKDLDVLIMTTIMWLLVAPLFLVDRRVKPQFVVQLTTQRLIGAIGCCYAQANTEKFGTEFFVPRTFWLILHSSPFRIRNDSGRWYFLCHLLL